MEPNDKRLDFMVLFFVEICSTLQVQHFWFCLERLRSWFWVCLAALVQIARLGISIWLLTCWCCSMIGI